MMGSASPPFVLLAYEPTGELAETNAHGVTFLGIEATSRAAWPALRHVFDIGHDAGLHVEIGPFGDVLAFAVAYSIAGDELLSVL